jgi:hypothetical protein
MEMKMSKRSVKPAKGTKGFIIRVGDCHMFRVYDKDFNFVDYDITHHDLEVVIMDEDASLYRSEFGDYIDHSPINELE